MGLVADFSLSAAEAVRSKRGPALGHVRIPRFAVLDSFRGLAATAVALYHFKVDSHAHLLDLVANGYLFVDFFFVLSGFVIFAVYGERLMRGEGVLQFVLLRLGRVYPLHLAFLLLWVVWLALVLRDAASFPGHGIASVLTNLTLTHGLGVHSALSWNYPSWSVSTEFFTYVIFAACALVFRRYVWAPALIALAAGPIVLSHADLVYEKMHVHYGFVRCLAGFSAGILCFYVYARLSRSIRWTEIGSRSWSVIEAVALAAGVFFVSEAPDELQVCTPFVASAVLLVFSREGGVFSRILSWRPFLFLGLISYSIYMTHALTQRVMVYLAGVRDRYLREAYEDELLAVELWVGDVATLAMLTLVIAISSLTYWLIESPGRNWFRTLAASPRLASG